MAERVGFEPTVRLKRTPHFECGALDRTMRPLLIRGNYRLYSTFFTQPPLGILSYWWEGRTTLK
ncbi:MAG: hypothetical protein JWO96_568 [Candidatus Saccharibacteria bacterium]|nr:hypothetical protein [Candidatus Saccharibacteria bacterium]